MALAMALLPCLNGSAKYLGRSYSTVEIVWARYAGHFAYMVVAFFPRRGLALFATSQPWIQVLRSALLLSATGVYFTALHYTDLPTAAIISFVSPFIMIALAALALGETVGPRRWLSASDFSARSSSCARAWERCRRHLSWCSSAPGATRSTRC